MHDGRKCPCPTCRAYRRDLLPLTMAAILLTSIFVGYVLWTYVFPPTAIFSVQSQ